MQTIKRLGQLLIGRNPQTLQILVFFLLCLGVYSLVAWDRNFCSSKWNQHVIFADAYARGNLSVERKHFELLEKDGRFYNPQGPAPALLMTPLALIFGTKTSDYSFAIFLSAVTGALFMLALFSLKGPYERTHREVWAYALLFAFGTIQFAYATNGTFWFLSQLTAVFFVVLFLAVWFKYDDRQFGSLAAGLCIGASILARYHAVIAYIRNVRHIPYYQEKNLSNPHLFGRYRPVHLLGSSAQLSQVRFLF